MPEALNAFTNNMRESINLYRREVDFDVSFGA